MTTTQPKLLAKVVDTILGANVLFSRIVRKGSKWNGRKVQVPVKVSTNTGGGSFRGADILGTSSTDNRQLMEFTPFHYSMPSHIMLDELTANQSPEGVTDLMKVTLQSDAQDMADDLGTLFYLDGTGNSSKDPLGMAAHIDDGTSVATYGGLSRSTYTTLKSTVTASGGLFTLAKVDTLYDAVTEGMQKPTIGVTTEAIFSFYGQLLRPQERINKNVSTTGGLKGGTGFTGLDYRGADIVADPKCTSQTFFFVNEQTMEFKSSVLAGTKPVQYGNQIEGNNYDDNMGFGFSFSDWILPANQAVWIGHHYFGGIFYCTNPRYNGKLTGISSI